MAAGLPTYDKRPWYRQFWPWLLIALPGSAVVAGLITLYIAIIHSDDLVDDEYYKDGLAINRVLDKDARAQTLGVEAQLRFSSGADTWQVEVHTKNAKSLDNLSLSLSHPLEADRDFVVLLSLREAGVYDAELPGPVAPHWHWILESSGSSPWRLDGSVAKGDIGNEPND